MRLASSDSLLICEIIDSLQSLGGWGSLEIFVQDNKVTQITKRAIKKTNHSVFSVNGKTKMDKLANLNGETLDSVSVE